MSSASPGTGLRRISVTMVMLGALLFVVYQVLKVREVANIGATGDIGGGLILLLAYALIGIGGVSLLVAYLRGRGERPDR